MVRVISTYGGLSQISDLLSSFNAKRIFLVTGRKSYTVCGAESILDKALSDFTVERFSEFEVNPKIEDGVRGALAARKFGADLILAVGGGSPMDMAKLIKAFLPDPKNAENLVRGKMPVPKIDLPLVCVPTTAGSGSEATHFAVVYINRDKFSLASPALLPNAAILDGQLLKTASPYQRAVNGLDAMAQATEGAWAVKSTEETRALSFAAISTLCQHLPEMINSDNARILQAVMIAANQAGQVINVTKTTAPHAFSYGFTSLHNIPHGHAVWLTLPAIFACHMSAGENAITDPRGEAHFRQVMKRLSSIYTTPSSHKAEAHLKAFMNSIGVEPSMITLGADTSKNRALLASQVNQERLTNNPVTLSREDLSAIFQLDIV